MPFLQWSLSIWVILSCAYWLLSAVRVLQVLGRVPILSRQRPKEPGRWPPLSIIIPACNEADQLELAVASRLRGDYPDFEIVVVDDRSTDDTGEIIDRLAAADNRVTALHITELPDRWIGKVYAQHRGTLISTGEWLLFSDADVHIAPGTLRQAVAYCEEQNLDHLTVLPELWRSNFLLDVFLSTGFRLICLRTRIWAVADRRSNAAVGVGAFNLVRRAALARAGGFEALKLEVVDDVALGHILKKSGAASCPVNGRGLVGLYFYRSLREAAQGMEKSVLRAFGFSFFRLVSFSVWFLIVELGTFVGLLSLGIPWLRVVGAVGAVAALAATATLSRWMNLRILPTLLVPVGTLLMLAVLLRSGWLAVRRGGLLWRGTLYPISMLRQNASAQASLGDHLR